MERESKALAGIIAAISILPGKPEWEDSFSLVYAAALQDVPEDAAASLLAAVAKKCRFRPTPAEVLDFYVQLTDKGGNSVPDIMGEITNAISAYGAMAAPHPGAPDRWPDLRALGPPPNLSVAAQRVVAAWGGWESMANDPNPSGVFRGHLRRMVEDVVKGGSDETMKRLRLEYAAQTVKSLPDVGEAEMLEAV